MNDPTGTDGQRPRQEDLAETTVRWLRSLQDAGLQDLGGVPPLISGELAAARASSPAAPPPARPQPGLPLAEEAPELPPADQPAAVPLNRPWGPALDEAERIRRLDELNAGVRACQRCEELARCRRQTVFGVGTPRPRLCFFGEAPGADEDRLGEPFVGRAGEMLNRIIGVCHMKREELYILNTVKCRPPGNRNPHDDEIARCRPWFEQQLETLQPEFICCLGSIAARTLLQTRDSVGRLRGRFHHYRGSRVVVTYHPSYLLRTPAAKAKTWEDIQMLMQAMGVQL